MNVHAVEQKKCLRVWHTASEMIGDVSVVPYYGYHYAPGTILQICFQNLHHYFTLSFCEESKDCCTFNGSLIIETLTDYLTWKCIDHLSFTMSEQIVWHKCQMLFLEKVFVCSFVHISIYIYLYIYICVIHVMYNKYMHNVFMYMYNKY